MKSSHARAALLLISTCSIACGQEVSLHSRFAQFEDANERFGRKLLKTIQESVPGKNIVFSPLSLSVSFAPLTDTSASISANVTNEIENAFDWTNVSRLDISTRMLLKSFDGSNIGISSAFYYRGPGKISEAFIKRGESYFGLKFESFPPNRPEKEILARIPDSSPPREAALGRADVWIVNSARLRTIWAGNTFSLGTRKTASFFLSSGQQEQVPMMVTESSEYAHAKTNDFEAVALYCADAYILVVEPAPDKELREIEIGLADGTILPDAKLRPEIGKVELPRFDFQFESEMRPALEKLGVHQIFSDSTSLFPMAESGAVLQGVVQHTQIEVNREGIRANATTVTNGIYGGICGNCVKPFNMVVDRPFVFLIRDNQTHSLLFAGSVVDPAVH